MMWHSNLQHRITHCHPSRCATARGARLRHGAGASRRMAVRKSAAWAVMPCREQFQASRVYA